MDNEQSRYEDIISTLKNNPLHHEFLKAANYQKKWTLATMSGAMIELSGDQRSGKTTLAARLTVDAQRNHDVVAWIIQEDFFFFPPDMEAAGVDLDGLIVIRLPQLRNMLKAADQLLRSKGFGLIVIDVGRQRFISDKIQARFVSMAAKSGTTILFLTTKPRINPSLGSMISFHGHVSRYRRAEGNFSCEIEVKKDKRRGPCWSYEEECLSQGGLY